MQLICGQVIEGFKVLRKRYIHEQDGMLYEFVHNKTGAELCFLDAPIENKTFYAAFKTIPFDNTGVFHILEHSVLCGSEKYPVREPFVELLKSSMQTFLNAMTFPDKTVYPVSSRNEQDFLNLTEVYLDAVFAPRCPCYENIFMQEGWHIESEKGENAIRGVVFNEMKGAMADIDTVTEKGICALLYPDSCYRYVSGGDPAQIPTLSFRSFKESYAKYYHPSNCKLYLDGSVPLEKTLKLISGYLDRFEWMIDLPQIQMQQPISNNGVVFYEIDESEEEVGRSVFTMARIYNDWADRKGSAAIALLLETLSDSNSSPLKKAILDKGLGEDIEVGLMTGTAQNFIYVMIRNTDPEKEQEILECWRAVIEQLIRNGIDKKDLEARISAWEYRCRDNMEPRGLYRGINALDSWLYGGDPALYLTYEDMLSELKAMLNNDGFEKLLPELLPDKPGTCFLWTLPSKTLGAEKSEQEKKLISDILASESDVEKTIRLSAVESLHNWQKSPDSNEQLGTLPVLSLDDIDKSIRPVPTEKTELEGIPMFTHRLDTSGLVYATLYFSLADIPEDHLPAISLYCSMLTDLPTANYPDVNKLQRDIKIYSGGIYFSISVTGADKQIDSCCPYFTVKLTTVPDSIPKIGELISEVLLYSVLNDENAIRQVLMQEKEGVRQNIITSGHSIGMKEALAPFSAKNAVTAYCSGYQYSAYLKNFADSFDIVLPQFRKIISHMTETAIRKEMLILSVTSSDNVDVRSLITEIPGYISDHKQTTYMHPLCADKGIVIPASVGFASSAICLKDTTPYQRGVLSVAAKILSLNSLWNRVRVQGGAYGAGLSIRRDGCAACYSYRDPTPANSLNVFYELADDLVKWCEGDEKPDKYIISTLSDMVPLLSASTLGAVEDARLLDDYTFENRCDFLSGILASSKEELLMVVPFLERFKTEAVTCLIGGEELIPKEGRTINRI